jgi:hypothetical protein
VQQLRRKRKKQETQSKTALGKQYATSKKRDKIGS